MNRDCFFSTSDLRLLFSDFTTSFPLGNYSGKDPLTSDKKGEVEVEIGS